MPITPSVYAATGKATNGATTLTTNNLTVVAGGFAYVQFALYSTSLPPSIAVTDSQQGTYTAVRSQVLGNNVRLVVYRRNVALNGSTTFQVTVTLGASNAFEIQVIEVLNDGGVDIGATNFGTGTSESCPITTTLSNDLVLFLGADASGTFSSWGAGQTGIPNYPTPPTNVTAWGSYQVQTAAGNVTPTRTITSSKQWAAICVAILPGIPWFGINGKPHVTVSPVGTGNGANYPNDLADFGPDTPSTVTSGIQEAINSLPASGGTVYLIPKGIFSVSTSITIPSNVVLKSDMWGGESFPGTVNPPPSYISPTFSTGDVVLLPDESGKNGLIGVAVVCSTLGSAVRRVGTRMSFLVDCFLTNSHGAGGVATQIDGSSGHNAEDNYALRCYFDGNPAIQIGVSGEGQKSNNCRWDSITAENSASPTGGAGVVSGVEGNNHVFVNFYSRNNASPLFSGPVGYRIYDSELQVTGGAVLDQNSTAYAEVAFENCTFTNGFISWQAGPLSFRRCKVNTTFGLTLQKVGPPPPPVYPLLPFATYVVSFWIHGSSAKCFIDRTSDFSGVPASPGSILVGDTSSGGNLYYEADNPFLSLDTNAVGGHFATYGSGSSVTPRGALLGQPAVSNPYQNASTSRIAIYLDGTQTGTKITAVDGTTTLTLPSAPRLVILNPGEKLSFTTAPASWALSELD